MFNQLNQITMKAKELKALLDGVNENADVLFQDVNGMLLEVIHGQVSKDGDAECVYLNTRQEFPSAWFDPDTNEEFHWIHSAAVKLAKQEIEDEISISFNEDPVKCLCKDGVAVRMSDGVPILTYPKLSELTDEQIEKLDDELGGRISDSGFIGFDDVAVTLGKPIESEKPKEEPKKEPKYKLDRDTHLLCESIQEVTLYAWPKIWNENKYDQDSRDVLETIRGWGCEFENYWAEQLEKDEDYADKNDYLSEIYKFTEKKCQEYLEQFK